MEARVGRAHSRGELGILGKRPLDLLEQPLLVFRERHGTPPRSAMSTRDGSTDRDSQVAAYPQVYEGVRGSESGSRVRCAYFRQPALPEPRPRGPERPTSPIRVAVRTAPEGWRDGQRPPRTGQPRRRRPVPPPTSCARGYRE